MTLCEINHHSFLLSDHRNLLLLVIYTKIKATWTNMFFCYFVVAF